MGCQRGFASWSCLRYQMPHHSSVSERLGRGPIKNTLQHTHQIRGGTQSHSDEIMVSKGSSTHTQSRCQPRLQESHIGTLYHHPLLHSLMLFITLPAVTHLSGGNLILENICSGHEKRLTAAEAKSMLLCSENIRICEFTGNISVAGSSWLSFHIVYSLMFTARKGVEVSFTWLLVFLKVARESRVFWPSGPLSVPPPTGEWGVPKPLLPVLPSKPYTMIHSQMHG